MDFAAASAYRPARECNSGVAEFSAEVAASAGRRGAGRLAMAALIESAESAGLWKLLSRVFVENYPSRELLRGWASARWGSITVTLDSTVSGATWSSSSGC